MHKATCTPHAKGSATARSTVYTCTYERARENEREREWWEGRTEETVEGKGRKNEVERGRTKGTERCVPSGRLSTWKAYTYMYTNKTLMSPTSLLVGDEQG